MTAVEYGSLGPGARHDRAAASTAGSAGRTADLEQRRPPRRAWPGPRATCPACSRRGRRARRHLDRGQGRRARGAHPPGRRSCGRRSSWSATPLLQLAGRHRAAGEPGRMVIELRPPGGGQGRRADQDSRPNASRSAVMFCGDDLGDRPAFAAVRRAPGRRPARPRGLQRLRRGGRPGRGDRPGRRRPGRRRRAARLAIAAAMAARACRALSRGSGPARPAGRRTRLRGGRAAAARGEGAAAALAFVVRHRSAPRAGPAPCRRRRTG